MQKTEGETLAKRFFYFILTNILVITTITIIFSLFNIGGYIDQTGNIQYGDLLLFSAIVGFTGSFISLAMSRFMAKQMMRIKVLNPSQPLSPTEQSIVDQVHRFSRAAGLTTMPEVGIYDSPEVNAFATGPSKKRSLVAVSSGLLQAMDGDAVEGVIAHEVAHIANGDMVTMTLLQGIVNTFVIFLSRIFEHFVSRALRIESGAIRVVLIIVFQIAFSILGSIVVMAFSRYREYHADAGGAALAGRDKMVHALQSLKAHVNRIDTSQESLATLKINNKRKASIFASHPDLDDRIKRLQG